jgi:hypothetical protein
MITKAPQVEVTSELHKLILKQLNQRGFFSFGDEVRMNPFTKVQVELQKEAVILYDFIVKPQSDKELNNRALNAFWHRCRHLFLELWPDAYKDLID